MAETTSQACTDAFLCDGNVAMMDECKDIAEYLDFSLLNTPQTPTTTAAVGNHFVKVEEPLVPTPRTAATPTKQQHNQQQQQQQQALVQPGLQQLLLQQPQLAQQLFAALAQQQHELQQAMLRMQPPAQPSMPPTNQQRQLAPLQIERKKSVDAATINGLVPRAQHEPYMLIRGARKSVYEDVDALDILNSLPYKYCLKVVLPLCDESLVHMTPEMIQFQLICIDPDNLQQEYEVKEGIVLEKLIKTKMASNQECKEFEWKMYFNAYSHGFNRSGFVVRLLDARNGRQLLRSREFVIYARRNRGSNAGMTMMCKRKREHMDHDFDDGHGGSDEHGSAMDSSNPMDGVDYATSDNAPFNNMMLMMAAQQQKRTFFAPQKKRRNSL